MKYLSLIVLLTAVSARADALNWQITVPAGGYDSGAMIAYRLIENGATVTGSTGTLAGPFTAGANVNVVGADAFQGSNRTLCVGIIVKSATSGSTSNDPANPQVVRAPSAEVTGGCAVFRPPYAAPVVSGPK